MYGTFNWNYAILLNKNQIQYFDIIYDNNCEYWYDYINKTLHIIQK